MCCHFAKNKVLIQKTLSENRFLSLKRVEFETHVFLPPKILKNCILTVLLTEVLLYQPFYLEFENFNKNQS